MKTKLCAFLCVGAATALTVSVGKSAFAQMGMGGPAYNNKSVPTGSPGASPASVDAGNSKPGTRLPGGVIVATPVTVAEAQKKYPMKNYPAGDRPYSHTPGHILSPYPPHQEYECSGIARGGLVLDTRTNRIFVRP